MMLPKFLNPLVLLCGFAFFLEGCSTRPLVAKSEEAAVAPKVEVVPEVVEPTRSGSKTKIANDLAISIQNDFGDVRLRFGGFEHELELSAVAQAPSGAEVPTMHFDAATGSISTSLANKALPVRGQRIDIVAFVPEGHSVSVQTLAGFIEVRGVVGNVKLRSNAGGFAIRGVKGAIDAETLGGAIEVAFVDGVNAPMQRLATSTGQIIASFGPAMDATLHLASSGLFATEFSTEVQNKPGEEPNKLGTIKMGAGLAHIEIRSKRGELRLYRRRDFVDVES